MITKGKWWHFLISIIIIGLCRHFFGMDAIIFAFIVLWYTEYLASENE